MQILGAGVRHRAVAHGVFHCERCGGDRPYRHWSARRYWHVLFLPVARLEQAGEHLQCAVCRTCYRVELLAVPTTDQMQRSLLAGTRAAVLAMLQAGDRGSPRPRRRAIRAVAAAGLPDYDEAGLAADLGCGRPPEAGAALQALAIQLETSAREWFLAEIVRIGLADGPLTDGERQAARRIAGHLGMTQAQARDVIWLTEEAAPTG